MSHSFPEPYIQCWFSHLKKHILELERKFRERQQESSNVCAGLGMKNDYGGAQPWQKMERGGMREVCKIISDLEKTDWDCPFIVFPNRTSVQNMNFIS